MVEWIPKLRSFDGRHKNHKSLIRLVIFWMVGRVVHHPFALEPNRANDGHHDAKMHECSERIQARSDSYSSTNWFDGALFIQKRCLRFTRSRYLNLGTVTCRLMVIEEKVMVGKALLLLLAVESSVELTANKMKQVAPSTAFTLSGVSCMHRSQAKEMNRRLGERWPREPCNHSSLHNHHENREQNHSYKQ